MKLLLPVAALAALGFNLNGLVGTLLEMGEEKGKLRLEGVWGADPLGLCGKIFDSAKSSVMTEACPTITIGYQR
jgi:hypothetical protein